MAALVEEQTGLGDALIKELASIFAEASAKQLQLFGADLAQQIMNAKGDVDRDKVMAAVAPDTGAAPFVGLGSPKHPMNPEQQALWLACAITGMPPNPEADPGNTIAQALAMARDLGRGYQSQALGPASGSGAYTIPEDFIAEIERRAATPAVVWPLINLRPTRRDTVTKPEVTAYPTVNEGTAANSSSVTTGDEITETEPTIEDLTWTMRYFDARYVTKLDLVMDSPIGIYEELLDIITDAFVVSRESNVLNGAGSASSLPQGLLSSGSGITEVAISANPTVAKILELIGEVPARYRTGGRADAIMGSKTYFAVLSQFAQNVRAAQYLLGVLPRMHESASCAEGKILVGNFRYYVAYHNLLMYMVTGIRPQQFSQEVVMVEKWDGQPTITDAFRIGTSVTYDA